MASIRERIRRLEAATGNRLSDLTDAELWAEIERINAAWLAGEPLESFPPDLHHYLRNTMTDRDGRRVPFGRAPSPEAIKARAHGAEPPGDASAVPSPECPPAGR